MTRVVGQMLDHYGAQALQEAVLEALRRDVPHQNAVRMALERFRQERRDSPLVVPQLFERVQRMDVTVKPHRLSFLQTLATGMCCFRMADPPVSQFFGELLSNI